MVVIHGRWGSDEGHEIIAEFTIGEPTPCDAKTNQIILVKKILGDEERKALGLATE